MVRVERLGVRSKRTAKARRMVCSVCKTESGGRQETPRQQRLLHSMSEVNVYYLLSCIIMHDVRDDDDDTVVE